MKIRMGYEIIYNCPVNTSMIFMLHAQPHAGQRMLLPDRLSTLPSLPLTSYRDGYGNPCTRLEAPAGMVCVTADGLFEDSGLPEPSVLNAPETAIGALPHEALMYLLPSRYCESDLIAIEAFRLFGQSAPGWPRVQSICDFVNRHVAFGYQYARATRTALETYRERRGVCRDLAHLAIAFCRAMNIPARYVTSYLGDIGVPAADSPMDFAGSIEVYLGNAWHSFDPRNNARRIGRMTIARGRDAADVAISTTFGQAWLQKFRVWTDEIDDAAAADLMRQRRLGGFAAQAA
ncbi:MAG TPA: transglutaminase family protein [Steroidobacteraceae bacterium]|jgi:transglutaminase-like putative cysteine protease